MEVLSDHDLIIDELAALGRKSDELYGRLQNGAKWLEEHKGDHDNEYLHNHTTYKWLNLAYTKLQSCIMIMNLEF